MGAELAREDGGEATKSFAGKHRSHKVCISLLCCGGDGAVLFTQSAQLVRLDYPHAILFLQRQAP